MKEKFWMFWLLALMLLGMMTSCKTKYVQIFNTYTGADRTDLQTVRQGYSDVPSAFVFKSDNILNRNEMKRLSFEELPEVNSERWLSLENLEGEEWKYIEGYEGIYMISDYGRVKSLNRVSNGILRLTIKERILRQSKNRGYWWVTLKDVDAKSNGVHRLVAYHFCERIEGKNHVDHIDTNRGNNIRENLHFVDAKGNANNPITLKRTTLKNREINERKKKPVAQFDKDWNLIKRYDYINEAERETGIGAGSIIKAAKSYPYYNEIWKYIDYCTAGGYYWRYVR